MHFLAKDSAKKDPIGNFNAQGQTNHTEIGCLHTA